MRLQKYLSQAGVASRRAAEELIRQGKIRVNGKVVTDMGIKVDPDVDKIDAYNKKIELSAGKKLYVIMNKPSGYLTTVKDPQGRDTVYKLLPKKYHSLFPVGRLDKDSQGLLLFTNDGELAQTLTHPKFEHTKEYLVTVDKEVNNKLIKELESGVRLEEGMAKTDKAKRVDKHNLLITLHQGWKRQIRRMLRKLSYEAIVLKRVVLGKYKLSELGKELYKEINKDQII